MSVKFYWAALVLMAATGQGVGQFPNYSELCSEMYPTKPKEACQQLASAAAAGNINDVERLLANVKFKHYHLQNALGAAAFSGHAEMVELLLNAGMRKHPKGLGTALAAAADQGHADIVKLLLDAGADPDAWVVHHAEFTKPWPQTYANKKGIPALLPGEMFRGSSSVGQITIIVGADGSPSTFQTIPSGNPVQVLTSGVYHFSGDVPQTALVMAAENGHVEVVKLLLLAGAHRGGRAQLYMGQIIGTGSKLEQAGFINFHVWTVNESALEAAKHANQQKVLDLLTPPSSSSALVNPKQ